MIGAASLIGNIVYVANLNTTETYGFDAANGKKVWTFRTAPTTRSSRTAGTST